MAKPFCKVVPLRDGGFAVQSTGAQWGVYDTPEEAQGKADRLNEATRLPDDPANAEYARACPECGAQPGEPCWRLNGGGRLHDSHRQRREVVSD